VPSAAATTFTLTVHDEVPVFRLPLATVTEVAPAVGVNVVDGQVVEAPVGLATTSPAGNVSVNDQPTLAARSVVLVIVNVSVDGLFGATEVGENDFSKRGVASHTVRSSKAASLPTPLPLSFHTPTPNCGPVDSHALVE